MTGKSPEEHNTKKGRKAKVLKWLGISILVILGLLLISSILVQIPAVQSWIVNRITKSIEKEWGAEVSIDKVHLRMYEGLVISGLFVEDLDQDTLAYIGELHSTLNQNFLSLIKNKIDLEEIYLKNGQINIETLAGDEKSNFDSFLTHLKGTGKEKKESKPFDLKLGKVILQNVLFSELNENTGKGTYIDIDRGVIDIELIDIACRTFAIKNIEIRHPIIQIYNFEENQNIPVKQKDAIVEEENIIVIEENLFLKLGSMQISDGVFQLLSLDKEPKGSSEFDPANLNLSDVDLELSNLEYYDWDDWLFELDDMSFINDQGFQLDFMRSDKILFSDSQIRLEQLTAKTPKSYLANDISLKFRSFEAFDEFEDQVIINAEFDNSKIALRELLFFLPKLKSNSFFSNNQNELLQIDGRFFGRVNNFSGRNVNLWLGQDLYFNGQFDSRNLTVRDEELFNLKVKRLRTSMISLKQLIPGFNPPDNYGKLGRLNFDGSFDGYIEDFVAYGNLLTDLGKINVNMRLDLKAGADKAQYSGDLQLSDFDLQSWSGNDDLGKISFRASVDDGKGLTLESAFAKLGATIDSIDFKGYRYNNIVMDGAIDKSQFTGNLEVADENIDFKFDGSISSLDSLPEFEFQADIKKLKLFALNLSKDPFNFSGKVDIDMSGKNLENIVGNAKADSLLFEKNDTSYFLTKISISSKDIGDKGMEFQLNSDIADTKISGIFDLREIPKAFKKILQDNYPEHIERLGMKRAYAFVKPQDFNFEVDIIDSKNFMELAGAKGLFLSNLVATGSVNTIKDEFDLNLSSPLIRFDEYSFFELALDAESKKNNGSFNVSIDTTFANKKRFNPIRVTTAFDQDTLNFNIETTEIIDSIDIANLKGAISPINDGYEVNFYNDEWFMFDKSWTFNKGNSIYFDKDQIIIDPLIMTDGYREILLDDNNEKGIHLELNNFNFDLMNAIIKYDKIWFAGECSLVVDLNNVFKEKNWKTHLQIPSFTMNNDSYGQLDLKLSGFVEDKAKFKLDINDEEQKFEVKGIFDNSNKTIDGDIDVNDYPLKIFEYILKDGISETTGVVDIDATIQGEISELKLDGVALTDGAGTKVVYLGTFYRFDKQKILISESFIDITGVELTDTNDNIAVAVGGLRHDLFADFQLDVNISSPKFIALNTTKLDNPIYYGFGQGELSVDFSGPFDSSDIRVNATTAEDTKVIFPIRTLQGSIDESFIKFVNQKETQAPSFEEEIKLLGLDFEMSLEMTDEAEVSIIFDERFNEILKGKGRGNMQIGIKRNGEFDVFGDYEIEQGEYLFTAYGLVAKPFILKRGGRLTWTGDPFDARLDIEADYKGLRAPLNVFLSEYLTAATPEVQTESRKRTNIDLSLLLQGTLFNPIINFDINFPDVQGELKSYTDSKMRTLRNTPNGINNQVVGLFVFRNFLPSNNPLGNLTATDILQSGYNTISEFFFTQISLMFTSFFEQALVEKGLLSSVDFEIGLSKNTEFNTEADAGLNPDEVEINMINRFADDRLALNLGTNFVTESPFDNVGSYILGDVVFEWFITADRKIKLKVYGIYDYDALESGSRKQKYGVGISYRKEFGNLIDFKKSVKEAVDESFDPNTSVND